MEFTILVKAMRDEVDSKTLKEELKKSGCSIENFNNLILESVIVGSNYFHSSQQLPFQNNVSTRNPNLEAAIFGNNIRLQYQFQENSQNMRSDINTRGFQDVPYFTDFKQCQMTPQQISYKNINGFSDKTQSFPHPPLSSPEQAFVPNQGYFHDSNFAFSGNNADIPAPSLHLGDQNKPQISKKLIDQSLNLSLDYYSPQMQESTLFQFNPIPSPIQGKFPSMHKTQHSYTKSSFIEDVNTSRLDRQSINSLSNAIPGSSQLASNIFDDDLLALKHQTQLYGNNVRSPLHSSLNEFSPQAPLINDDQRLPHTPVLMEEVKIENTLQFANIKTNDKNRSDFVQSEATTSLLSPLSMPESNNLHLEVDNSEMSEMLREFYSISKCPSYLVFQSLLDESDISYCIDIYSEIFGFTDVFDKESANHLKDAINEYLKGVVIKSYGCDTEDEFFSFIYNKKKL